MGKKPMRGPLSERKGGWSSDGSICSGWALPTVPLELTEDDEVFRKPKGVDVEEAIAVWMPSEMGLMLRALHGSTLAFFISESRAQNLVLTATPKKLLVGETLHLECRAETFINGRIELIWTCPNGRVSRRKLGALRSCSLPVPSSLSTP